jgi:ABC-2 type transport system permease protein
LVAIPVQLAVVVAITVLTGSVRTLPAGVGVLAASFGASVAVAALLSVLVPYALPETTNPFAMSSGSGSAKGLLALLALLGTLALTVPVVVASLLLSGLAVGPWIVLGIGLGYGLGAAWLGTYIAGDVLERRGPEILIAVTPRR